MKKAIAVIPDNQFIDQIIKLRENVDKIIGHGNLLPDFSSEKTIPHITLLQCNLSNDIDMKYLFEDMVKNKVIKKYLPLSFVLIFLI